MTDVARYVAAGLVENERGAGERRTADAVQVMLGLVLLQHAQGVWAAPRQTAR